MHQNNVDLYVYKENLSAVTMVHLRQQYFLAAPRHETLLLHSCFLCHYQSITILWHRHKGVKICLRLFIYQYTTKNSTSNQNQLCTQKSNVWTTAQSQRNGANKASLQMYMECTTGIKFTQSNFHFKYFLSVHTNKLMQVKCSLRVILFQHQKLKKWQQYHQKIQHNRN